MIGKPEWFTYRILGWGIRPKTWQGWAYLAIVAALVGFITAIAMNEAIKLWLYIAIIGIFVLDILHIMTKLGKVHDERENYHQLIIERNCSFAAIAALMGVALYQTYQHRAILNTMTIPFDHSIIVVLVAMVVVKIASYIYVKNGI